MPLVRPADTAALLVASAATMLALGACAYVERESLAREPTTVVTLPPPQQGSAVDVLRTH